MADPLAPDDAWLATELSASYGPAVGAFYDGACHAVSRNHATTTHVVGHLMREAEASIRDVLRPLVFRAPAEDRGDEERSHRQDVARIVDSLPLRSDDPLPELWYSLVGELHRYAHRSGQQGPRPVDSKFLAVWNQFGLFLTVNRRGV